MSSSVGRLPREIHLPDKTPSDKSLLSIVGSRAALAFGREAIDLTAVMMCDLYALRQQPLDPAPFVPHSLSLVSTVVAIRVEESREASSPAPTANVVVRSALTCQPNPLGNAFRFPTCSLLSSLRLPVSPLIFGLSSSFPTFSLEVGGFPDHGFRTLSAECPRFIGSECECIKHRYGERHFFSESNK